MVKLEDRTEVIKKRYNRTARVYDLMDWMLSGSLRSEVLSMVRGKILEVGIGTGKNLPFYPPGCNLVGIDFSPEMLKRARSRADALGLSIELIEMDAQNMAFPDHSFDTVVATCVFCSVPDPVKGLREIRRVCKPGGRIILLEHVRSEHPVMAKIMDVFNPLVVSLVGANINRDTVANVHKAGLTVKQALNKMGKIVKLILAEP